MFQKISKICNEMKKLLYFLILACFFSFYPFLTQAGDIKQENLLSVNFLRNIPLEINLKIGSNNYALSKATVEKWTREKSELFYRPKYHSEIENPNFCQYKKSIICSLFFDARKENHIQKISTLELDEKLMRSFLDDLARQTDKDPENAKFGMENGKVSVFSLGAKGTKLNKEQGLQALLAYFKNSNWGTSINLPYDESEPEISTGSIYNLGINSLIGEGRSNFRGSPKNRIFNINVATKRFDGILIKPGEEFSFVKILGEVDKEHGYLPELVIKKDKTEPEFGGGICQVSTTAFRAAIYSGLEITARRNHAYPVQYYNPQGMDATVYVPRPDLRFLNNTPGHILIQTKTEGTELVFQFYGTDDGRKTKVIGPTITERNPDGSLKAPFPQEVRDKDGHSIIEDVFNSAYDSPSKYPHPGQTLTQKPAEWSDKEWKKYKKENNL